MSKAFVPYLTAGYPSIEVTRALAHMLADEGADVLELGVPFTDPIADGAINQRAGQRALDAGVTPGDVLQLVKDLRADGFALPIVLFTYSNPLLQLEPLGGVSMVLVTDLPPEEAGDHIARCRAAGIDTVFLAAPTTPLERIATIAEHTTGFLYYVSSKGVTGARSELPADLEGQIERLRQFTDLPIYVGFGISTKETAARVCAVADGYVVGSAIGRVIEEAVEADADPVEAARAFVRSIDPR
ncbi:MAG: tryptophan synthase subunit alpha [Proteobacteria bacterium]|nr:tryptophan synthase subunit alpha [Pseudomonadota bacterium]